MSPPRAGDRPENVLAELERTQFTRMRQDPEWYRLFRLLGRQQRQRRHAAREAGHDDD